MDSLELDLRTKLAITHHVIHHFGWDDMLATHISARIPNTDKVLITPHNKLFSEVTAENIVTVKLNGEIVVSNGAKIPH